METLPARTIAQLDMWESSSEEAPARVSPSPESGLEWTTIEETSRLSLLAWFTKHVPGGSFSKTCPASSQVLAGRTSEPSSQPLPDIQPDASSSHPKAAGATAGSSSHTQTDTVLLGRCLTLNSSESRSAAGVCSLSDILDRGHIPQKYFLSPRACEGILRRAERRGKVLPGPLAQALRAVADTETTPIPPRT